jgi:hypothetical protein
MRRLLVTGLLLLAGGVAAEPPALSARSRVEPSHVSVLAGTRGFGLGLSLAREPTGEGRPGALSAELLYVPADGVLELAGARQWRLTGEGLLAASMHLGVVAYGVLRGPADVGIGPSAGLFVGLGGPAVEVFLGGQAGAEAFLRTGGARVPLRGLLGLRGRVGTVGLGLTGRAGVDVEPGLYPTWRGEVLLVVSGYGLPEQLALGR